MKKSAGILLYRKGREGHEVFLVHPGGPFWKNKDAGAWSIPKGEFQEDEDPLVAARREFGEETGIDVDGKFIPLTPVKQKSGKIVYAWALENNIDATALVSNTCTVEWPPRSGKQIEIPEVDKGGWFTIEEARNKLIPGQVALLSELHGLLDR